MNKKLICLLVALCLVIGMLPVMSIAADPEATTAKVAITKTGADYVMEATEGGDPVYGKSVAFTGTTNKGTYTGYEFTKTGASDSDWNFKFEYPQGGVPTLTLKDAKLINMDESGNTMSKDGASTSSWTVVQSRNIIHPIKVVLQGQNEIQVDGFVRAISSDSNKFSAVTVTSENGGSLTGTVKSRGIQAKGGSGDVSVVIDSANIGLTSIGASAGYNPVYTENGNITIKDSDLKLTTTKGTLSAIHANGTGVINVVNSQLELTATGTAFNKTPMLAEGFTAVAGEDAATAAIATEASALLAKYAKVTYPAPTPTETSAPTEQTTAPTEQTTAPTEQTTAPTEQTTAPTAAPTAPAAATVAMPTPATAATSGTVTLWGTAVTVNAGEALYWVNGAEGATPVAATAADNWNYSFAIIDGIPTVTLRNANYVSATSFLEARYDGFLKVKYEGTNELKVTGKYFLYYRSSTNAAGKGNLIIEGAADAVLNVTGGNRNGSFISTGKKEFVTFFGGTVNLKKTVAGGVNPLVSMGYSKTTLESCTLNITMTDGVGGKHPAMVAGYSSYGMTVNNSKLNIQTNAHTGLCIGVFQSNMEGVLYAGSLTVAGNSDVKIVNNANTTSSYAYNGAGVYATKLIVKGGFTEIQGKKQAVYLDATEAAPDLSAYNGDYEMFTEKDGAAVTAYTATTYFKVNYVEPAPTEPSTTPTETTAPAEQTTAPTEQTTAPTEQTTAPTEQTTAPTQQTTAPTQQTTAPTAPLPTAPAAPTVVALTTPATVATSGTVTLFGTAVTVNAGEARYWVNGAEEGAAPVAAAASDNWNYSFAIVDGIPTVTLKNANYSYAATMIKATYDGVLMVKYEGENNVDVVYAAKDGYAFLAYSAATNTAGKGQLYLIGAEGASLNVTGGSKGVALLSVSKKAYFNVVGGTVYIERTNAGGVTATVNAGYSRTIIENCDFTVKSNDGVGGKHPAVITAGLTINNTKVLVETNAHTGVCAGVFQSNMEGVLYDAAVVISGNSNVKIVDTITPNTKAYSGVGLYAKTLTVKGGNLEIEGKKQAVYLSGTDAVPALTDYNGSYAMYTEKDGAAVTAYTATPYFKVVYTGEPAETTAPSQTTAPSASTTPGQTSAPTSGTTPSTTSTAKPSDYTLKIYGDSYTLSDYDAPVYMVNGTKNGYYKGSETVAVTDPTTNLAVTDPTTGEVVTEKVSVAVTKEYKTQVKTDANESNYNAKLIWHTGDEGPTLYLRDFVIDEYVDGFGWRYGAANLKSTAAVAGIFTDKDAPLKIVIESGACYMRTYDGIHYQNDLTIESVGDASLTVKTNRTGIVPTSVGAGYIHTALLSGNKLTLNANLTVSQSSWARAEYGYIITTIGADMVINGGNIVAEYTGGQQKSCKGIAVQNSGNLYINGGYIKSESYNGTNNTEAAIEAAGDIYITGGTVDVTSSNQSGLRATNIYMTGGTVKARVSLAPLLVNAETGVISFTGGVIDALGTYPFRYNPNTSSQATKEPVVAEGLNGWVGKNPYVVEAFAGEYDKYVKIGYGTITQNEKPVPVPGGDILLKTTVKFGTLTLELKKYDEPIYTINNAIETTDTGENAMTRWTQTTSGANEDNWNAKFVWNSTDDQPTLYLRGFKMDDWNNETGKYAVNPNNTSKGYYQTYSITTGSEVPTTIILTGEDSLIECQFGITFNNNLTIKSEGETKLTMNNQSSTISPNKAAGFTLTIDANLVLTIRSFYNTEFASGCIMNYQGDIIINGGTIKCSAKDSNHKNVNAIVARSSGNIVINGGDISGNNTVGQSHANGVIQTKNKLIINGGKVDVKPNSAIGLYGGEGIEINGGEVKVTSPWYGITTGTNKEGTPIVFNGGTTTIMAERSFYSYSVPVVQLGEKVKAYGGSGKKNAEVYDGTDKKVLSKPWFFVTDDPEQFIEIDDEEEDVDIPVLTLPTQATQPATQATGAPDATVAPDATGAPDATLAPDATGAPDATLAPDATAAPDAPDATLAPEEPESNTKIELVEGGMAEISQELIDAGMDSVETIWYTMLDSIWTIDENIDSVSFFDALLMYKEGDEWIKADETHFPEDGFLVVTIPYPEGTDINTEFTGLHMFSSSAFGKTPGEIELVYTENTEEGVDVYVTGLSPIMLGWVDGWAQEEAPGEETPAPVDPETDDTENPPTGDTGIAVFAVLMLAAAMGRVAVVVTGKKRII